MTPELVVRGAVVLTTALLSGFTGVALLVRWLAALFEAGKGRSL